jgi:hypothetical protein
MARISKKWKTRRACVSPQARPENGRVSVGSIDALVAGGVDLPEHLQFALESDLERLGLGAILVASGGRQPLPATNTEGAFAPSGQQKRGCCKDCSTCSLPDHC